MHRRHPQALLAAGLAAVLLSGCTAASTPASSTPGSPGAGGAGAVVAGPVDVPAVVRAVEPSVVTVLTEGGVGSGVVYRADGIVVTNEHVVRGAEQVRLALANGERVDAEVVAADAGTDLAVLQADRQGLPAAEFQEELPEVGELAIALGSPLGFENTATAGIISGTGREIPDTAPQSLALVDLVQTDAAISPGNSGGALVNGDGEVVGINDAYIPPTAGAVSIGFAIPTATVVSVVEQLLDDGQVTVPFVGIQPGRITPQLAERFDLPPDGGVLVQAVVEDSPAQDAGLQPGDVVTAVGEERVRSVEGFLGELRGLRPGQQVTLTRVRDGIEQDVRVTLSERRR